MKKLFNLFVLGLIMFIGCLVNVKAESVFTNQEIFFHDWDTSDKELVNEMLVFFEAKDAYEYGFVATDITLDFDTETVYTKFIKYSPSGKVLKEVSFTNAYLPIIEVEGDYIYVLSIELDEATQGTNIYCVKYDSNLSEVEREKLGNNESMSSLMNVILFSKTYGLDVISTDTRGNTYLLMITGALGFGPDYDGVVNVSNNASVLESYSWYFRLESLSSDYLVYVSHDSNDTYNVYSGAKDPNNCDVSLNPYFSSTPVIDSGNTSCTSAESGIITLYQDDKEVWSKLYSDYDSIVNVQLVDDYIVAIGEKDLLMSVIIVDMSGELVQKVDLSERYLFIDGGDKNFIVSGMNPSNSTSCTEDQIIDGIGIIDVFDVGVTTDLTSSCYSYRNEVWYIPLTIETKTDGNGTVTAAESSRYGEDVEFTVTPKEGFVLGEVKVTDEFGNVVVFTDYHFTMPNSNVLIDVTFLPDNSDTSDFTITILISIAFVACIVFIVNKRKVEKLV